MRGGGGRGRGGAPGPSTLGHGAVEDYLAGGEGQPRLLMEGLRLILSSGPSSYFRYSSATTPLDSLL